MKALTLKGVSSSDKFSIYFFYFLFLDSFLSEGVLEQRC